MTDAEMINSLKNEGKTAFHDLVCLYQNQLLNTCYRFVPNRSDAEDLTQEVFITAFQSIDGFRGEAKISTWLYRIAVTKCLDFIRKNKRKKRFGFMEWLDNRKEKNSIEEPPSLAPNPEAYSANREQMQILLKAMDSLSENQRVAFTLSKCDGMSCQQIAEVMGASYSAVESLIFRARKNLEKCLHDYYKKNM